ncbi:MAG TPA: hypothetical protein VIK91_21155, partial [Nannocystis sp.]
LSIGTANDKFVVKVNPGTTLPAVGGNGGGPFNSLCPADQVVVGFYGRSGSEVDQIGFRCAPFVISENAVGYSISLGAATNLPAHGGGGGAPFPQTNCPANQVANRKYGRSGSRIDRFGLVCGAYGLSF